MRGKGASKHRSEVARSRWRMLEPYLYLSPMLIGIVVVSLGSIIGSFVIGFTDWDLVSSPKFVGTDNYARLLSSDLFWKVLGNTLYYVLLSVPPAVIGATLLALLADRRIRGITFFRTVYFFPVVSSMVAVAMIWSWLYNPEFGAINFVLRELFGIDGPRWLSSTSWSLPAIALMTVWKGLGYNMLIILAGLQAVPRTLHEAALMDGAGPVRRFFSITLPMLSPTIFFVTVITTIGSFQIFEQTYVLTQGGPANSTLTLSYYIYQNAFQFFRMGYATAMAYVLFALTFVVTLLQFRMQKKWVYYG